MNILSQDIFLYYFGSYSAHAITLDNITYPTIEHAYQCSKYEYKDVVDEILNARSPLLAWQVSQKHKPAQKKEFNELKLNIMEKLLRLKVEQHEDVRQALIDSNNLEIIKHIVTGPPADGYWDDGIDGNGLNQIGRASCRERVLMPV